MSSIDITSTNDMTSTAAASEASGSFAGDANHHHRNATHAITTDAIIRECIKQGFYRNPICNEKLYLHNRGFDSIAPTAFEPYTDVKVLWLEGNGFASLPCGVGYTQVQPPVRIDPFAELAAEGDDSTAERHADPMALGQPDRQSGLPLAADIPPEERDAFSSLYPTVRQLYLHNNLFRTMPDLSRFQRLDSVNLSGNFISAVAPHCIYMEEAPDTTKAKAATPAAEVRREQSDEEADNNNDSSISSNSRQHRTAAEAEVALIPASASAAAQREAQLEAHRRAADAYAARCEHCPLPEPEEAEHSEGGGNALTRPRIPRQPPMPAAEYRNPCSSLRSLNVAGNRLESFEDCLGLLAYKALAVLDLSHNNILDGEALLLILERLPRLQSLKLSGNPLVRTLPRYRKRLLARCKRLLYLDDRPVFEEERRLVTAWAHAGNDGEEKERKLIQQEKAAAERRRLDDFRRLIARSHDAAVGDGPHAEYVRAITTTTALSAAGDTVGIGAGAAATTATSPNGCDATRRTHRGAGVMRRPFSDPDNSPTSSESDSEEGDEDVDDVAVGGTADRDRIGPVYENSNKPSRQSAARESPARVLSSNQRVTPRGSNGGDEDDADDIFVPQP